jgi:hypothetical protein
MMQQGGAALGQGVHGRTIESHEIPGDPDTLYDELRHRSPRSPPWQVWLSDSKSRKSKRSSSSRPLTDAEADEVVRAVRRARGTVAKRMTEPPEFEYELATLGRIRGAYGSDADAFTTLGALRFKKRDVAALHVPATGAYFIFSSRCDTPLDRYPFARGADVDRFVVEILESFAKLHAAGFIHGDVKLDNMIHCECEGRDRGKGDLRAFRLIDWGAATEARTELPKRYLRGDRPRNSASPLAWYAWGLGPILGPIAVVQHARHKGLGVMLRSFEYVRFTAGAIESARRRLAELSLGPGELDGRRLVLREHWRSFDLYSFGVVLAVLAHTTRGGAEPRMHERLMDLATALTHYGTPGYCGDDAEAALARWTVDQQN